MLDYNRIYRTQIPDIAPVYAGVRGRTISSRHQSYAWPALVEAGVKRVIDLRDVDVSNKLPQLCQEYGIEDLSASFGFSEEELAERYERFLK